jgi:hypothetical protein
MRCHKCSYISFDDLVSCSKCAADLTETVHNLRGTSMMTIPSFFLAAVIAQTETSSEYSSKPGMGTDWGGESSSSGVYTPDNVNHTQEIDFSEGISAGIETEETLVLEIPFEPSSGNEQASSQIQFTPGNEPQAPKPSSSDEDVPTLDLDEVDMIDLAGEESLQTESGPKDNKGMEEMAKFDLSSLDLSDLLNPPQEEPSGMNANVIGSDTTMDLELLLYHEKTASDISTGTPAKGLPEEMHGEHTEGKTDNNELKLEDLSLDLLPDK